MLAQSHFPKWRPKINYISPLRNSNLCEWWLEIWLNICFRRHRVQKWTKSGDMMHFGQQKLDICQSWASIVACDDKLRTSTKNTIQPVDWLLKCVLWYDRLSDVLWYRHFILITVSSVDGSLNTKQTTCLSVCLSGCPSVCLYVCVLVCLLVCLSVCWSACLYIRLFVCRYAHLSACLLVCLCVCLSGWCPSICLCVCLYVCLSACMSIRDALLLSLANQDERLMDISSMLLRIGRNGVTYVKQKSSSRPILVVLEYYSWSQMSRNKT